MAQNVSMQTSNNFGSISRLGTADNGRVVFQIINASGEKAAKVSLAPQEADVFEKSYQTLIDSAPKIEKFIKDNPPEKLEKKKKTAKWIIALGGVAGGIVPLLKSKINGVLSGLLWTGLTIVGTLAGLALGALGASKLTTPQGMKDLNKATAIISKLDIQPVEE